MDNGMKWNRMPFKICLPFGYTLLHMYVYFLKI